MARERGDLGLAAAVGLASALAFLPTLGNGLVEWDDTTLLVRNAAYRGFGATELSWMFTTTLLGHYAPVAWLSWAVDDRLWGGRPFGFHLTSLLLHALNSGLLCLVARHLFRAATTWGLAVRRLAAAGAALAWGVHPLRVETVAWATERRGVLCGTFVLLSVLTYLRAAEGGRHVTGWRALSVSAYALALGAKASAMTLPVVLFALDVYPLRRLPGPPALVPGGPILREKVPYVLVALGAACMAAVAVSRGADAAILDARTWLAVVSQTLWFPVAGMALPVALSPLYQLPTPGAAVEPAILAASGAVLAISTIVVVLRRRWPVGPVAWGAYVVLLVPVMGVVHAGVQATADRYSYLPSMGLALVIGAGLGAATRALQTGRLRVSLARLGLVAAAAWILSLGVLTWRQTGVWRDNATLWTHAVGASPGCALCRTNLGVELLARGQAGAALGQFERALATRPESTKAHGNLGRALAALGRHGEAVPHYERMLQRYPGHIDVRVRLAQSLVALRRLPEAVEQVRVAVHVVPAAEAIDDFQRRVAADPGAVVARLGLAVALRAAGRIEDARAAHEALRAADPELAAEAGPGFDQILAAGQPAP